MFNIGSWLPEAVNSSSSVSKIDTVGPHQLVTGDCQSFLNSDLTDKYFDVVVTSPPYNLKLDYDSYQDDLPEEVYLAWLERICLSIANQLAADGSFFLNVSGSGTRPWLPFLIAARLRKIFVLQNHICWIKSVSINADTNGHFKPIAGSRFLHQNHEHIFHFTLNGNVKLDRLAIGLPFKDKTNITRRNHARDLKCRGNTWYIPYKTVQSKAEKFNHPGSFPVLLPLWCIYLHGKVDALVLDPFSGIGTTQIAADMSGGIAVGIDRDPGYVDTAKRRLILHRETSMFLTLNADEIAELLKQDPETAKDGGFQGLMVGLQNKLNKTTGGISLSDNDLERIPVYAFKYKKGGWENRLQAIFSRHLGPDLKV